MDSTQPAQDTHSLPITAADTTRPAAPDRAFILNELHQVHGGLLIRNGLHAFRHTPGLLSRYLIGVALTLILTAILLWLMIEWIHQPWIHPALVSGAEKINHWWSGLRYLTTPSIWLIQILCWLIMLFIAIKTAAACMGFWIDLLIERIIDHHRPGPDDPIRLRTLIISSLRSLALAAKSLIVSMGFLILGFIPIVGIFFSFIGIASSLGADIIHPYLLVLAEKNPAVMHGPRLPLRNRFRVGWLQALISLIPIIGWLFMPFFILLQIIGMANHIERKWTQHQRANPA